jgi:hypothetical protein
MLRRHRENAKKVGVQKGMAAGRSCEDEYVALGSVAGRAVPPLRGCVFFGVSNTPPFRVGLEKMWRAWGAWFSLARDRGVREGAIRSSTKGGLDAIVGSESRRLQYAAARKAPS